ncbi:potassium channel family protein [Marivirga harenae]|uniref:potassium channel family protein n=1 Tax=Marivirga harenae TaxID=2010992 RepID=UPI0026DFF881|nr:potassium channel family protein [Marivirga harenae]WKV12873.1 potassium channel family protein [Marivirga harenae]|tara:strand:- start:2145 stop:3200 length:1056 start_codon:yes stop_codon:yes gene_type:complete
MDFKSYKKLIYYLLAFLGVFLFLVFNLLEFELHSEEGKIDNLSDAFWYSIVTLTTVGYGDMVPTSSGGRAIGYVLILLSLGVYGLLIGQISNIMTSIKENKKMGMYGTDFQDHIVVIGWTQFGKTVIDQLIKAGRKVAIVTKNRETIDLLKELYQEKNLFILYSDYENFELLEKVNIEKSSTVFINLNDDTEKLVYILNLKKEYENLNFTVTLENSNLKQTFISAGVTHAISQNEIASRLLASYMFEPDVALFSEEILAYPTNDEEYDMKEFKVVEGNPYNGQEYDKVFFDLKKNENVILLGLVRVDEGKRMLYKNPSDNFKIKTNDYLIMLMNQKTQKKIKRVFELEEGV